MGDRTDRAPPRHDHVQAAVNRVRLGGVRAPSSDFAHDKCREGPRNESEKHGGVERMRIKFDTAAGRAIYGRRMGTVEPVFGNLQNKGMRRFTLRGRRKVNAQWQLFTMVHNIEKIASAARTN